MADTVLVTGASGFIALHCIEQLLRHGHQVRGTLRSLRREPEVRSALKHLDADDRLSFAVADLTKDEGWDDAVTGCDAVLHVASPFPANQPRDEDELIRPAREGALRVLKASARGAPRRVVMTSSMAAVCYGPKPPAGKIYDESDWTPAEAPGVDAYTKSKTLAERAAWEFVSTPEANGLELAVINPGLVLGPLLSADTSTSLQIVIQIMKKALPAIPRINFTMVDVRDVADAHIRAMNTPEAAGKRFCCLAENAWMHDVAVVLDRHFGDKGYDIPTGKLPDFVPRIMSIFQPMLRRITPDLGVERVTSSARLRDTLGWTPRGLEEMTVASAQSLIEHNVV